MMVPVGPLTDKDGNVTRPWREFFQTLATAVGGPAWLIVAERIDDETFKFRMRGSDRETRESAPITLT